MDDMTTEDIPEYLKKIHILGSSLLKEGKMHGFLADLTREQVIMVAACFGDTIAEIYESIPELKKHTFSPMYQEARIKAILNNSDKLLIQIVKDNIDEVEKILAKLKPSKKKKSLKELVWESNKEIKKTHLLK